MGDNYIYIYTVPYCKWYNEITIYVTTWLIAPYIWIAYTGTTIYIYMGVYCGINVYIDVQNPWFPIWNIIHQWLIFHMYVSLKS